MARGNPKHVVAEVAKNLRVEKVLIDWSQNSDFKTTVSVYSMRAKGQRPLISMPIAWDELARAVKRKDERGLIFTADAAAKRIGKVGDLFAPVLELKQELPAAFTKALSAGPQPKLSGWPRNSKGDNSITRDRSLREYTAKRDLTSAPEPGTSGARRPAQDRSLLLCFRSPKSRRSGTHSLADSSGAASYCAKSSPNQELRFDCHPSLRRMPRRSWAQSAS